MKLGTIAAAVLAAAAAPALATSHISIVSNACISVADAAGCRFTGNITAQTVGEVQSVYNLYNDNVLTAQPDISLSYLFDTDSGLPSTASVTGLGDRSGTWDTGGILVNFLGVKAGNGFTLFQLDAPASSGTWNTGVQQGLSHLSFMTGSGGGPLDPFDSGVPEPASWAMLIAGFGLVGATARRRRDRVRRVAA